MWGLKTPWAVVVSALLALAAVPIPTLGQDRLAVATDDAQAAVIDLATGATVWTEPSTAPAGWSCWFLRQRADGAIVLGHELDEPTAAAGRWWEEVRDAATGALLSALERTDGPVPRFPAPDPHGRWVYGSSKWTICKPLQGGCFNSWGMTAWANDSGALRQIPGFFKCQVRFWRRSTALDAFVAPTHEHAEGDVDGPWWVNLAFPPAGEASQWESPLASDGVAGERAAAFFIEEVATGASPTGVAWVIGGRWGWKAVRVDAAAQVPQYADLVPAKEMLGHDLRESLRVGSRLVMAERTPAGAARAGAIDVATLSHSWTSPSFAGADWTFQALAQTESCVVLATPGDGTAPPGLHVLSPACGAETRFIPLPAEPRFLAPIE